LLMIWIKSQKFRIRSLQNRPDPGSYKS
jgi:hypothetical protein